METITSIPLPRTYGEASELLRYHPDVSQAREKFRQQQPGVLERSDAEDRILIAAFDKSDSPLSEDHRRALEAHLVQIGIMSKKAGFLGRIKSLLRR